MARAECAMPPYESGQEGLVSTENRQTVTRPRAGHSTEPSDARERASAAAIAAMRAQRWEDAARCMDRVLAVQPDLRRAMMLLAVARIGARHFAAAAAVLRIWLARHPGDVDARVLLARAHPAGHDEVALGRVGEQLVAPRPGRREVLLLAMSVRLRRRDFDGVREVLEHLPAIAGPRLPNPGSRDHSSVAS